MDLKKDEDFDLEKGINKEVLKKGILGAMGYKVNRWIIYLSFVPSIIIFLLLVSQYGIGSHWFLSCPDFRIKCFNPYWEDCDKYKDPYQSCTDQDSREKVCVADPYLCQLRELPGGFEAGVKPNSFYENAYLLIWIFPLIGAAINHLIYNRKFKWRAAK